MMMIMMMRMMVMQHQRPEWQLNCKERGDSGGYSPMEDGAALQHALMPRNVASGKTEMGETPSIRIPRH